MQLQQNVSLKPYNTFGIDVVAEYFLELTNSTDIEAITQDKSLPQQQCMLGGGSNVLLTKEVSGLCILNRTKGISKIKEDDTNVWLQVSSGEVWHEFVLHCISNGWAGIENLSLIPGTVGAAPMQNIGAYGVEAKEVIEKVRGWHREDNCYIALNNEECRFGYRDSIFKHELKNKVYITDVTFKLNKQPDFNTSYGAIAQQLDAMKVEQLSIKAISDAVIAIRSSKLPNPQEIGNAGSFFKNPTIGIAQFNALQKEYSTIPNYPVDEQTIKVPAGWLIEQCGFKGMKKGNTGVHAKQALVLVNYGNVQGSEVYNLSEEILQTVNTRFGIMLEREVQIW